MRLHSGYAHVWEKVRKCLIDHIKAEIEADGPIEEWGVHGHSAGGALAQILILFLKTRLGGGEWVSICVTVCEGKTST